MIWLCVLVCMFAIAVSDDVSAITTASTISESSMAVEDDDTHRGAERVRACAAGSVGATSLHLFVRKPGDVVEPGELKNDSEHVSREALLTADRTTEDSRRRGVSRPP
jgi:hypothetical protein